MGDAAVYAMALLLLMSFSFWAELLKPLASVGRMTLTTYLTQSLICTTLFYSYGFGLYGRVYLSAPELLLSASSFFRFKLC